MTYIRMTSAPEEVSVDDVDEIKNAIIEAGYSAISYIDVNPIYYETKVLIETDAPSETARKIFEENFHKPARIEMMGDKS